MIQFEKTYDINDGNGSITFKKVDDLTVEAVYNRGTIKGTWDGETLKCTFIDNVSNGNGLIHFNFNDNGFEAKWKAGLDEGTMKGKWLGKVIASKRIEEHYAQKSILDNIICKEDADWLNTLFKTEEEFYHQDGFDFERLNKIADTLYNQLVIGGSNSRSGDIIDFILGSYDHGENKYTGTRFTDVLKNLSMNQNHLDQIKAIEKDFLKKAEELKNDASIEKRDNKADQIFNQYIDSINNELEKEGIIMQRSINPRGGEGFGLIFFYKNEQQNIINFLVGYRYAKDGYDGWWEDAFDFYLNNDKNTWYSKLIRIENIDSVTNDIKFGFIYDKTVSEYASSNFDDLNISKANLYSFIEGEFAAWQFSKMKTN